ncbi:sugar phosphate isomerase/epimerase family protein [Aestuariimicrobium kwangyangense]|uniref:sugar phosphate isomerase/epimerase family protein n=1 Tax=Aestuariimicrobium kwangyangense TaxID=396389 RepID=UPI0003B3D019|nr:sugar phosphate isomerase/epimerase family protein [Aestuariimicrobium kwangyangense]
MTGLERLSLNQKTTNTLTLPEAIELCVRQGLGSIGVWREPLAEIGVDRARRLLEGAGLRVSSLCRGGFLTSDDPEERRRALDDNLSAIRDAAAIGAPTLVMVVGGLPAGSKDLDGARDRMAEGIAALAPAAADHGVTLGLEPMHPIFAADRGVLSTLGQALELAEQFPADRVGVVVDSYHVWWDPELARQVNRAGERIVSFQVCDWVLPLAADTLLSRGMMGDGHIDFAAQWRLVEQAGYRGDIEVEIFNADVWASDPDEVVATMKRRYLDLVVSGR